MSNSCDPQKQFLTIQLRRGSESEFFSSDPILASGEPAFTIDTNILKIGDGINTWSNLAPIGSGTLSQSPTSLSGVVMVSGDQTINGQKTFLDPMSLGDGSTYGNLDIYYSDAGFLAQFRQDNYNPIIRLNAPTHFGTPIGGNEVIISSNAYWDEDGHEYRGAITQGVWRGDNIQVDKGGTGRSSYSNGQLLIGSGNSLIANKLTAGSNIQIVNGSGTITISATGLQPSGNYSTVGHTHTASNITDFNDSVSGIVMAILNSMNIIGY